MTQIIWSLILYSSPYHLRHSAYYFFTPLVKKVFGKKAFRYKAPADWNNLPSNVRSLTSFYRFKKGLFSCLKFLVIALDDVSRFMGSRSHPHRVLCVCVCVCVSRCLWVCVIWGWSAPAELHYRGLYQVLSRCLPCQILAAFAVFGVFAVDVYGPFRFRDSWALLLPGLRSPDLGCPLLPCATRLSPTGSSVSAYGKLRVCLRKLRLCPTEAPPLPYGKLRLVLAVYYYL